MLADLETETELKTDGPKHPGRVLYKAETVQHSDSLFFDIPLGAEKINQLPEGVFIERDRQGIDGKITSMEIEFERTVFHNRQRSRRLIIFKPR